MLALELTYYVHPLDMPWQIPLLLVLLAGWLWGGAFLVKWSVMRLNREIRSPFRMFMLASFLATVAAVVIAVLIVKLFEAISNAMGRSDLVVPGIVASVIPAVAVGCLIVYVFFDLPKRGIVLAGLLPMAGILVFSAGIVTACAIPAKAYRERIGRHNDCVSHLSYITRAVALYWRDHNRHVPQSLDMVANMGPFDGHHMHSLLECPGRPGQSIGYFYMPIDPTIDPKTGGFIKTDETAIRVCDYRSSHEGSGRAVMFVSFAVRPRWVPEAEVQELLNRPENKKFKETLQEAEGK